MRNVDPDELLGKAYDPRVARRLLSLAAPYKRRALATAGLIVVVTTSELLIPWLFSRAIDEVDTHQRLWMLNLLGVSFLAVLGIRFLASWGEFLNVAWLGNRIVFDLRNTMFRHLQTLSMSYIDKRGVGSIMTRIQNDVAVINEALADGMAGIVANILVLVGIIVVMFITDWKLALLALLVLPIMSMVVARWRVRAFESYRATRRTMSIVNATLAENINGMRVVQAFTREGPNFQHFDTLNHNNLTTTVDAARLSAYLLPIVLLIGSTATAVTLYLGGRLVFNTTLTIGELVLFIALIDRFFEPVRDLSQQYNTMQAAMAAGERIFEVLDVEPEIRDAPDAYVLPPISGTIKYDGVTFGYGQTEILHAVDLDIAPGETVAYVGETGAGKSSMVNLLMRFYDVWDGAITVDGHDLRAVTQESLRSQLGVVLQDTFLFGGTVRENVRYGRPDATDAEVEAAARDVGAHDFIVDLPEGYETRVNERGVSLSVGQRQLLSFARALLSDPRILILDEATSSIDSQTERVIQSALRRLLQGRTSFVIAHRLSTIREADKVVVMDNGRIVELGTHDELLAQDGLYANLIRMQWHGGEIIQDEEMVQAE